MEEWYDGDYNRHIDNYMCDTNCMDKHLLVSEVTHAY